MAQRKTHKYNSNNITQPNNTPRQPNNTPRQSFSLIYNIQQLTQPVFGVVQSIIHQSLPKPTTATPNTPTTATPNTPTTATPITSSNKEHNNRQRSASTKNTVSGNYSSWKENDFRGKVEQVFRGKKSRYVKISDYSDTSIDRLNAKLDEYLMRYNSYEQMKQMQFAL